MSDIGLMEQSSPVQDELPQETKVELAARIELLENCGNVSETNINTSKMSVD